MPKIRRSRKPPPEGYELIEETLQVRFWNFEVFSDKIHLLGADHQNERS